MSAPPPVKAVGAAAVDKSTMAIFTTTQELYCLVPPALSDTVLEPLREHLAGRGIAALVDRRAGRKVPYTVARQRAMHLPRALPDLPDELEVHRDALRLVQRMAPAGLALADHDLLDIVEASAAGDGPASSELVFRISARVFARLERRHARAGQAEVERVLGRVLDRVEEFDGSDAEDFHGWLDDVVDAG